MKLRRKGFALYTAVMMGMLITGVIAALTMGLASDVRRTARLRNEAQMTQLLLAGMHFTEVKLADGSMHLGEELNLPAARNLDATVQVKANLVASTSAEATVTVTFANRTQRQHLKLQRQSGEWRSVAAEIEP